MGFGDDIIATGLARGMASRGKRAAFGDGRKIFWGPWSEEMFQNNPNIARPGSEQSKDLEWVAHYKGSRMYNKQSVDKTKWVWNTNFKVVPGEFYFADHELKTIEYARPSLGDFVVIEPNVPWQKSVWPNKDWGEDKYKLLAERLQKHGVQVVQFVHKNSKRRVRGATTLHTESFRKAIGYLSLAKLYIGPEGGMHHAAAAVGVKACVLMGGFIPPAVVGYDAHRNFTGGAEACGSIAPCHHCKAAMERISVDEVFTAAMGFLK